MKWFLIGGMALLFSCSHSQGETDTHVPEKQRSTILDSLGIDMEVARNPKYRFQFVATSIQNGTAVKSVAYGTDKYYYPASLVKIPTALVALEELNRLQVSLDAFIRFDTDTVEVCGSTRFVELTAKNNISFRQMLSELIVVSDNQFYNVFYHFITPATLRSRFLEMGFDDVYVYKDFTGCDTIQQLTTYPYFVWDIKPKVTTRIESFASTMNPYSFRKAYEEAEDRKFGSKHENEDGEIVDGPFDLNYNLEIPLESLHEMMSRLLFPQNYKEEERWNIRPADREFLIQLLQAYPSEIKSSYRSIKHLEDSAYKYVPGTEASAGRTFGKLGLSYGFASETVFVPTKGKDTGVLLSYSVYVNSNDIVNDGEYDYETVARPFAKELFSKVLEWHKN
jgi:hypothetical protein